MFFLAKHYINIEVFLQIKKKKNKDWTHICNFNYWYRIGRSTSSLIIIVNIIFWYPNGFLIFNRTLIHFWRFLLNIKLF